MEGEDIMNTRPVFKTAQGWVRQFDDGSIVGPFDTKMEAVQAVRDSGRNVGQPAGKKWSDSDVIGISENDLDNGPKKKK